MSLVENSCRPGKPASGLWDSSAREDVLSESGLRSCTVACRVRRIRRCMLTDGEPVGISRDEESKSFFKSAGTIFSGLMTVRCGMQKKESGRLLPGQTGVVFCGTTAGFLEEKSSSEEDRPEYVSLGGGYRARDPGTGTGFLWGAPRRMPGKRCGKNCLSVRPGALSWGARRFAEEKYL